MNLLLHETEKNKILIHAMDTYPDECCGFLFGTNGDTRRVITIRKVQNQTEGNQHRRFKIDPSDYRKAEDYALERDFDLLGVYHSHPDHPAEPSDYDRQYALPWFSYIIVSVDNGKASSLRSWRLRDDHNFSEETVDIVSHQSVEQNKITNR